MKFYRKQCSDYIEYVNENGKQHREDGPAIEYADGTSQWIESESVINGAISFGDFCRTSEWRELVKSGKITILDTNYFKSKGL